MAKGPAPTADHTEAAPESPGVLETFALGAQWPTIDPFLFVAHHRDDYPRAAPDHGPAAPLDGRQLGQDFADIDGWNMYHGQRVPGFPQHPHRGFETVTYVRKGLIDHADSLGAAARYGHGDTQWMTAGAGVVHSEMFPLLDTDGPNPAELFQIWINLPAADKMAAPAFKMFWAGDTPEMTSTDASGRQVSVTVIAGALAGAVPPSPPPNSWAAKAGSDVCIWHVRLERGARWELPARGGPDTRRVVYVFEGDRLVIDGTSVEAGHGAVVDSDRAVALAAGDGGVECLVMAGRPIAEPVARYGPFVMNDRAGIEAAVRDYQSTGFGGWPWPDSGPVHGDDSARFARYPDGRVDRPELSDPNKGDTP